MGGLSFPEVKRGEVGSGCLGEKLGGKGRRDNVIRLGNN